MRARPYDRDLHVNHIYFMCASVLWLRGDIVAMKLLCAEEFFYISLYRLVVAFVYIVEWKNISMFHVTGGALLILLFWELTRPE